MIAFAALMMALTPVTLPSGKGLSLDQKVAILAQSEARNSNRFEHGIYGDPAMRAEIKRVGLRAGCEAVRQARLEVVATYAPQLELLAERVIRDVIPVEQFDGARAVSFMVFPFNIYSGRVRARVDALASPQILAAHRAIRRDFMNRSAILSKSDKSEEAAPSDLSKVLGLGGRWDLDNPAHIGLACADMRIDPSIRPKFGTISSKVPSGANKE